MRECSLQCMYAAFVLTIEEYSIDAMNQMYNLL